MTTPDAPQRVAVLCGNDRQPEVRLYFDRTDRHAATDENLVSWVKRAPRRHWDKNANCWVISAFGGKDKSPRDPERALRRAGFTVVIDHPDLDESLRGIVSLADLVDPMCRQSKAKPSVALVRPRLAGWDVCREILGMSANWDKDQQRFEVPLTEILSHGDPKPGLVIDQATVAAAQAMLGATPTFNHAIHDDETILTDAAALAYSTGLNLSETDEDQINRLVDVVGDVPDWFGLNLYPYQRLGALAACAGRNFLADPTGLGKTRQGLAVLAIKDVDRAVIIVPPVVLTNWARECEQSGLAVAAPKPLTKAELKRRAKQAALTLIGKNSAGTPLAATTTAKMKAAANESLPDRDLVDPLAPPSTARVSHEENRPGTPIVTDPGDSRDRGTTQSPRFLTVFRAGRKEPELPERGILIVPDSLLASRAALRTKIAQWAPDALIYDEAHRARTWRSTRAMAIRDLCDRLQPTAVRVPMTATPLFSNPAELASPLAISGHLGPVFGGYEAFVGRYCKRNHFKQLVANKANLDELQQILRERVWVRRNKMEVLKDLPPKARYAKYVDVDLSGFRAAHDEVLDKIDVWLDAWILSEGEYPNDDDIKVFSRSQIGLMSPLRKAAGLAKVPVALDLVSDWIANEVQVNLDGTIVCDRPVVIWAHHHEVIEALVEHAGGHLKDGDRKMVGVIAGNTSADRRGFYVDEFQAGRLPVLICSISAAGVGITLTRSSDAVFVETSYSVPEVSQAEDRQWRIGQETPVSCTTLIAEGTLDPHIQRILVAKAEIIDAVLGSDDAGVAVMAHDELDDHAAPAEIIEALVQFAVERHQKNNRRPKAA